MSRPQFYSNHAFDRAAHQRRQPQSGQPCSAKVISIWKGLFIIDKNADVHTEETLIRDDTGNMLFLGRDQEFSYFGKDLSHHSASDLQFDFDQYELKDLRDIVFQIDHKLAALLAYLKGLTHWHQTHQYCSRCGAATQAIDMGHSRLCKSCDTTHFPRIDPAIIVLIEYRAKDEAPKCLMNIRQHGQATMCTAFAGFVEIGESLEDAVIREVKEEVNVDVENIRYVSSQPWSFPSSIMVGFRATAKSMDFKVDGDEIKEAKWYTANELKELSDSGALALSRKDSIASFLIREWMEENLV